MTTDVPPKPPAPSPAPVATGRGVDHADPSKRAPIWWLFQHLFCYPVMKLAYRTKVSGRHHVPASGGVLLVSNHQSFLDPILVAFALKRPVAFLAKSELFRNFAFRWWIRNLHAFPIEQGKGQAGPLKESVRLLKAGWMLNVFPEGERTPHGGLLPAKGGVAVVIRKAKVPVVPCVFDGAFQAWPRHKPVPRPWGKIRLRYGEAMELHDLPPKEILSRIDEAFEKLMAEVRRDA
jgi:1-acyl-sn-glycerol-3-phosphate acyltransferase